jgi:hypothetical protein
MNSVNTDNSLDSLVRSSNVSITMGSVSLVSSLILMLFLFLILSMIGIIMITSSNSE